MIDSYEFGRIVVDGQAYTSDLIILPDRVDAGWWRKEGHNLCVEDIEQAMSANPDVLVVGTGADGLMKVPDDTREYVNEGTGRHEGVCEVSGHGADRGAKRGGVPALQRGLKAGKGRRGPAPDVLVLCHT